MELSEKVENIGGQGGYALGGGSWMGMIFIIAIFFIMLLVLCRGRDCEAKEGCADKLTWSRYANYVDPEIMRNHIDQVRDTGQIRKDLAVDNGQILASLDRQTRDIQLNQERTTNNITLGQAAIAREQERLFFQGELNRKDERLAEAREKAIMLEGRLMQAESERAADKRQTELFHAMNVQNYHLTRQLDAMSCQMVKAPQFLPYGGIQSVNLCGYNPCNSNPFGGCA